MAENPIVPVLLCGGAGTRLWPLSRRSFPKQFVQLLTDNTMLQETALRVNGPSFSAPIVVTAEPFRFIVTEQLDQIGIRPRAVLLEPSPKNTGPAILAAAEWAAQNLGDVTLAVVPTDHAITSASDFQETLLRAQARADSGHIATLGIAPTHAATGYGYIEPQEALDKDGAKVARFLEKPNHDTALKLIKNPSILWNAGIFVLGAHAAISAFETHATDLVVPIRDAVAAAEPDFGFLRLAPGPWAHAESISFDYAVMEHATDVYVLPFRSGWSDLGSWDAIWSESVKDKQGVVTQGEVIAEDCSSTLLRASKEMALIGVGLSDLIVIAEPDAVLVADRRQSNRVGEALLALAGTGKSQATEARRDYRPWGWFESLKVGEHFQVKHICVKPEGTLSLQSHQHRAEHWIVVQGIAEVTIDGVVSELRANQSIYVPLGAVHRLRNAGDVDMRLIEVQTGSYFGEDDITRFDDVYARQTEGT